MTDNEIIKALECCVAPFGSNCRDCSLQKVNYCEDTLLQNTLDLINRQKAEIDGLKSEARRYKQYYFNHEYDKLEAEAIKAFAERLKDELSFGRYIQPDQIDNLVKEMIGEQE